VTDDLMASQVSRGLEHDVTVEFGVMPVKPID